MANIYRRLGVLCRVAHVVYGFLLAHAATINALIATIMFLSFTIYEFAETIHDILVRRRFSLVDFPDDEFAELGAGAALYVALRMLLHAFHW